MPLHAAASGFFPGCLGTTCPCFLQGKLSHWVNSQPLSCHLLWSLTPFSGSTHILSLPVCSSPSADKQALAGKQTAFAWLCDSLMPSFTQILWKNILHSFPIMYLTLNPMENGVSTYPHNQLDLIWQKAEITCSVLCPVWVLTTRRTQCHKVAEHANPLPKL